MPCATAAFVDDVEHHGDPRNADQRTSDEPQHGHASRNEAGPVHQVAQDQPVSDADNEARPEYERPITDRDERLCVGDERAGIRARSLLAQRHYRKETDDADGDEGAFNDTSCDVSESEAFVLPLEDREQHDGRADIRDDEDELADRSQAHARVAASTDDVVGGVQYRVVEDQPSDTGDEGDDEEHAHDERCPSI